MSTTTTIDDDWQQTLNIHEQKTVLFRRGTCFKSAPLFCDREMPPRKNQRLLPTNASITCTPWIIKTQSLGLERRQTSGFRAWSWVETGDGRQRKKRLKGSCRRTIHYLNHMGVMHVWLTLSKLPLADLPHGISVCSRPSSTEKRGNDTSAQKGSPPPVGLLKE